MGLQCTQCRALKAVDKVDPVSKVRPVAASASSGGQCVQWLPVAVPVAASGTASNSAMALSAYYRSSKMLLNIKSAPLRSASARTRRARVACARASPAPLPETPGPAVLAGRCSSDGPAQRGSAQRGSGSGSGKPEASSAPPRPVVRLKHLQENAPNCHSRRTAGAVEQKSARLVHKHTVHRHAPAVTTAPMRARSVQRTRFWSRDLLRDAGTRQRQSRLQPDKYEQTNS